MRWKMVVRVPICTHPAWLGLRTLVGGGYTVAERRAMSPTTCHVHWPRCTGCWRWRPRRRVVAGALPQIIDLMVLVVDAGKGIQTQTAECIVIGEVAAADMLVALNKIGEGAGGVGALCCEHTAALLLANGAGGPDCSSPSCRPVSRGEAGAVQPKSRQAGGRHAGGNQVWGVPRGPGVRPARWDCWGGVQQAVHRTGLVGVWRRIATLCMHQYCGCSCWNIHLGAEGWGAATCSALAARNSCWFLPLDMPQAAERAGRQQSRPWACSS